MKIVRLAPRELDAILGRVASLGGRLRIRGELWGTSMAPAIRSGDRIEIEAVRLGGLVPGDVAVYRGDHGQLVAHRVVRIPGGEDGPCFVARADAPGAALETVAESALVGRIRRVKRAFRLARLARGVLARLR